ATDRPRDGRAAPAPFRARQPRHRERSRHGVRNAEGPSPCDRAEAGSARQDRCVDPRSGAGPDRLTAAEPRGARVPSASLRPYPCRAVHDVVSRRLRVHHLVGEPFESAVQSVGWFGAVQSQDYPGAKWALGQRTRGAVDGDLDAAFDRGDILRTHVMRPTWHFVLPRDIRWIQELTSPRVMAGLAGRQRALELD